MNNTDLLTLSLFCAPNGPSIGYSVLNESTGAETSGTISANIPASNSFLYPQMWVTNNTTAAAATIALVKWYLETDN